MRYYTHSGSPIRPVFKLGVDPDTGAEELYCVGKEDFQEMIDASAESCDLNIIIARVNAGETELLNQRAGFYGDVSKMPMTLQEIMQTRIDARQMYNNLPDEQKKAMDFETFMKDAGSVDWLKNLGFKFEEVKEEVKTDAPAE